MYLDGTYCQRSVTGLSRYSRCLIKALDENWSKLGKEHSATVFGFRTHGRVTVVTESFPVEYVNYDMRMHLYLNGLLGIPNLVNFLKGPCDVVHFHDVFRFSGDVSKIQSVVTVHDLASVTTGYYSFRSRWLKSRALRRLKESSARIITVSEFTRRELMEVSGINPSRVTSIPLGIDGRIFEKPRNLVGELCQKHQPYVLFVGGCHPRKNVAGILRSMNIWGEDTDAALILAGPGLKNKVSEMKAFQTLSSKFRDRVKFAQSVSDGSLGELYRNAICLLFPSYHEGFGLPVAEAMCCGCPVICSNRGALPEVAGDAAIIVDPDDQEAMAHAVMRILSDASLRENLSRCGLERSKLYSWNRVAEQVAQVYLEKVA